MTAKKKTPPKASAKRYPRLPVKMEAPGGTVVVVRKPAGAVKSGSAEAWGTWEPHTRTIELDSSAPLSHQWRVLFHELAHVALDDAGLSNGMNDDLVEAVCDAVATQRMRERFG